MLGNDWMKTYNPTKFDHEKKCVTIGRKGNKTVLHAIPEAGSLSLISGSSMGILLRKGQTLMAHLFMVSVNQLPELEDMADPIQEVLDKYKEDFAEPKALPPVRSLDH